VSIGLDKAEKREGRSPKANSQEMNDDGELEDDREPQRPH
jgi:hypothetical protein